MLTLIWLTIVITQENNTNISSQYTSSFNESCSKNLDKEEIYDICKNNETQESKGKKFKTWIKNVKGKTVNFLTKLIPPKFKRTNSQISNETSTKADTINITNSNTLYHKKQKKTKRSKIYKKLNKK